MKMRSKTALLAGAAAGILGMVGLSGSALAFDKVHWDWYDHTWTHVSLDADLDIEVDPTGLIQLEKLQLFIGDATAKSYVHDIYNNQPSSGGDGLIDFTVDWSGGYDPVTGDFNSPSPTLGGDLSGTGDISGNVNESGNAANFTATFSDIPVSISTSDSYDALTELPEVVSSATAVGNNQNIQSDVSVLLHDTQVVFGGFCNECSDGYVPEITTQSGYYYGGPSNTGLSAALALVVGGLSGQITPSEIKAKSSVYDILNATVDSNATAVANNINVDLEGATADDHNMIADVTQAAYADVYAKSKVHNVTLNNYAGLGSLDRPIVSSVATAVGNNMNVTVSAPAVSGP